MNPIPWIAEINSLSWVNNFASSFIAAICVANTSYCSSSTELTFSWNAKNSYLLSPLMVLFMAEISSLTFFCFWFLAASSIYISYAIQSFSFEGVCLGWIVGFLIEFALLFFYLIETVSLSLAISFGIYLGGGSLGTYSFLLLLLVFAEFITFGAILLCEFLGSRICFWFWSLLFCYSFLLLCYSFLILPALYILWTYFFAYKDLGSGFVYD